MGFSTAHIQGFRTRTRRTAHPAWPSNGRSAPPVSCRFSPLGSSSPWSKPQHDDGMLQFRRCGAGNRRPGGSRYDLVRRVDRRRNPWRRVDRWCAAPTQVAEQDASRRGGPEHSRGPVLVPAPLGPSRAKFVPSATSRSMPSTTTWSPKDLRSQVARIAGWDGLVVMVPRLVAVALVATSWRGCAPPASSRFHRGFTCSGGFSRPPGRTT